MRVTCCIFSVNRLVGRLDIGWFIWFGQQRSEREGGQKPLSRWLFAMLKVFFAFLAGKLNVKRESQRNSM
jgi:hypothetical protein